MASFIEAIKNFYVKALQFGGRATRSEFLWAQLYFFFVGVLLAFAPTWLYGMFVLVHAIPACSLTVRRLHDTGRSGWCALLSVVPFLGGLILFFLCLSPGNRCGNKYGKSPYGECEDDGEIGYDGGTANVDYDAIRPCVIHGGHTFRYWDNIVGWMVFAIATLSYWATMEPTTSLWDCSEYIATSYKLEVGHPPGAPLYMMLARIASLFAPSPEYVPLMINGMNSLVSGFTILFMFWTITHLARRMLTRNGESLKGDNMVLVLGAGVIGALSYAYTDTFWFSAVEGEVYAMSSMFTALVVWLMLKWEENADSPTSMRWIILIAYLMGLSIGVHILNLLTIPALVMIYFFRRYQMTSLGKYLLMIVAALVVSMLILGAINGIIIPYTVLLGAYVDTFAVNTLGMPVNMGMLIYVILVFTLLGVLIFFSHIRKWRIVNIVALCCTVILLGFSSYAMMTIRANANPPMNSNNPNNPHMLLSVLNRDQYGARPLVKGVYYDAKPLSVVSEIDGGAVERTIDGVKYVDRYKPTGNLQTTTTMWYNPKTKKYEERLSEWEYTYPDKAYHYFPRMWYYQRANDYAQYVENPVECSAKGAGSWIEPSRGDDFRFFMSYQMGDMFWRYFMWNFVGRQDDVQLHKSDVNGGLYLHGGWLSGIDFIDENFCGPQDNLPSDMANNPARNNYFFLPLLLGLLGLIYHLLSDTRNWFVVMLMFVMMGVALVVYFNTAPNEPRERDYVYAGAFYAFSIWIGLGVMAMGSLFKEIGGLIANGTGWAQRRVQYVAVSIAMLISLSVPVVLAVENWDDHDRSERYFARDIGWNYLMTAPENAIIINFGDNDTFPLWYCQEVEGVRPDVKVMNSSYLDGEWYIDQMKLASNEAAGVPFTIPTEKYTLMDGSTLLADMPDDYAVAMQRFNNRPYTFEYVRVQPNGMTKNAVMTLKFSEVFAMRDKLYDEFLSLYNKVDKGMNLTDAEYAEYQTLRNQIIVIDDALAEDSGHPIAEHYNKYFEYMPTKLPLADVIAHYISDEPMWLVRSVSDESWRIVDVSYDKDGRPILPDGYEVSTELYSKLDSQLTGEPIDYLIYADEYTIPVDKKAALKSGLITQADIDAGRVVDEIVIKLPNIVSRGQLMMYDLLGNYDWSRPICFTQPFLAEDYGIRDFLRFDGYTYTFVPIETSYNTTYPFVGSMDIDKLYPLYMDECEKGALNQALRFGNLADDDVLADYFVRYNVQASGAMRSFARIANKFIERGGSKDLKKAEALLDRGLKVLPPEKLGYVATDMLEYLRGYYALGDTYLSIGDTLAAEHCYNKANRLNSRFVTNQAEWVNYYIDYIEHNDWNIDIVRELYSKYGGMCDALQLSYTSEGNEEFDLYGAVVRGCSKHSPEVVALRLMRAVSDCVDEGMPKMVNSIKSQIERAWMEKDPNDDRLGYRQIDVHDSRYIDYKTENEIGLLNEGMYKYADEKDVHIIYFIENVVRDMANYVMVPLSDDFYNARQELLKKSGFSDIFPVLTNSPLSGNDQHSADSGFSEDVYKVLETYNRGIEAWERSTEYLKQAVELMASYVGVEINVEKQDIFQYFYAYSDYAEQLITKAQSQGMDLMETYELLMNSDEEYSHADEYLKMGDTSAVQLIAQRAASMESAMQRMEQGHYVIDDALTIYGGMCDIIDVLSISLEMAGSFDWVANSISGYGNYDVEQVSFDKLMSRFTNIAGNHLRSSASEKDINMLFADVAIRGYELLPRERVVGGSRVYAEYVEPLSEYLRNETIMELCEEMYDKI